MLAFGIGIPLAFGGIWRLAFGIGISVGIVPQRDWTSFFAGITPPPTSELDIDSVSSVPTRVCISVSRILFALNQLFPC